MTDDTNTDDSIDPASYWMEVKQQLDDGASDDPVRAANLADDFAYSLAKAYVSGDTSRTTIDSLLGAFARNTNDIKKSTLEGKFEDSKGVVQRNAKRSPDADEDDGDPAPGADSNLGPIDHFLNDKLSKLVKYVPSDKSADARYVWQFRSPDIRVETTNEHLAINSFQEEIHVAAGSEHAVSGPHDLDCHWNVWIMQFIAACHESGSVEARPIDGQRTHAVEDLQNQIENTPATTDIQTAVQQRRPYVESEDADELQVATSVIERVLADYENVSYQDLQVELDEREHRAGNVRSTQVARGQNVRFWRLNRNWLDIEVEPESDEEGGGDGRESAIVPDVARGDAGEN